MQMIRSSLLKSLVISIHDVSPITQHDVEIMLNDLYKLGVTRCSLLVVPNYHHGGMIADNVTFARWLQHQVARGNEVVLHGFHHLRPRAKNENWWTRWMTHHYTMDEGEFYDLSKTEALEKLRSGIQQLREAKIDCSELGFIAPAWLLSAEAERALQEEKFFYTTRLSGVIRFLPDGSKKEYPSQSMVYSPRSAVRRFISLLWNEALFCSAKNWSLLRIGLHPPDWKHKSIRRHALSSIQRALKTRHPMTYREWVANCNHQGDYGS